MLILFLLVVLFIRVKKKQLNCTHVLIVIGQCAQCVSLMVCILCVCVGLAQYSGDPRIEWHLNTHKTKESVIDAVKNLPYKGGNTLTGTHTHILTDYRYTDSSRTPQGLSGAYYKSHTPSLRHDDF